MLQPGAPGRSQEDVVLSVDATLRRTSAGWDSRTVSRGACSRRYEIRDAAQNLKGHRHAGKSEYARNGRFSTNRLHVPRLPSRRINLLILLCFWFQRPNLQVACMCDFPFRHLRWPKWPDLGLPSSSTSTLILKGLKELQRPSIDFEKALQVRAVCEPRPAVGRFWSAFD